MRNAFSLVELSIVLVILGLLTGGILTGQSLIRSAELRKVLTQSQNYQTAMLTFREKYFALPGDMTNAQNFWGVADADAAWCWTTPSTGTETCNGNGDGQLQLSYVAVSYNLEGKRFWHHLANAGMITGQYTGQSNPAAPLGSGTVFSVLSGDYWSSGIEGVSDNTLMMCMQQESTFTSCGGSIDGFGADEAYGMDVKTDDGQADTGVFRAADCIASADSFQTYDPSLDNSYDFASSTGCSIMMLIK